MTNAETAEYYQSTEDGHEVARPLDQDFLWSELATGQE